MGPHTIDLSIPGQKRVKVHIHTQLIWRCQCTRSSKWDPRSVTLWGDGIKRYKTDRHRKKKFSLKRRIITEIEAQRIARHHFAVIRHGQEVTHDVSKTCRYYGVSRTTYYKWLRRYEESGEDALRDRSRAPINRPNATSEEIIRKILFLRSNYHLGPKKDRNVPRSVSRDRDLNLWGVANLKESRYEPASSLAALQATCKTLEAL